MLNIVLVIGIIYLLICVLLYVFQEKLISLKLKSRFKQSDTLITLEGQYHNGITDNIAYQAELRRILGR